MKYAQLIIGLLVGTALGGSVVAGTGASPLNASAAADSEAIKKIVREVIAEEPKLIVNSVIKYQQDEQKKQTAEAGEKLKDKDIHDALYRNKDAASYGPKDSKRTVIEFFDYNCPVCKMMFKNIDSVAKKDSSLHVVFIEYPIFGPVSDTNAKLGLAVYRLYPEKYYEFHDKLMGTPGHGPGDNKPTYQFIKDLGMDVDKVKAESEKKEVADILIANRELGEKLHVQGTPMLIIGDELIAHAISQEDLESRLDAIEPAGKEK